MTAVFLDSTLVVERTRRFPARVEAELARRRAHLVGRASGRVLDLDRPEARAEVAAVAAGGTEGVATYDTAVSVAQLLRFPDLVAALRAVDRLVAADGTFLLVEPTGRPGPAAVVLQTLGAGRGAVRGFHLGRDVTAALRSTGFLLDDIERFAMSTTHPGLRHAVEVHAVRAPSTNAAPSSESASAAAAATDDVSELV